MMLSNLNHAVKPQSRLLPHAPPPSRASSLTRLLPHAPPPSRASSPTTLLAYLRKPDCPCKPAPLNDSYVWEDCPPNLVNLPVILYIRQHCFLMHSGLGDMLAMPSKTGRLSVLTLRTRRPLLQIRPTQC